MWIKKNVMMICSENLPLSGQKDPFFLDDIVLVLFGYGYYFSFSNFLTLIMAGDKKKWVS